MFDNKDARMFDLKTFQPIQDLVFNSDYAIPKEKKTEPKQTGLETQGINQLNPIAKLPTEGASTFQKNASNDKNLPQIL